MRGDIERYLALREALGYRDQDLRRGLRSYGDFASARGTHYVRRQDVADFLYHFPSSRARTRVFNWIRKFSDFMRAEDQKHHELDARFVVNGRGYGQAIPYIYEQDEIITLIEAASSAQQSPQQNIATLQFLIGLMAATGMRVGEVIGLQRADFQENVLFIRKSKYRKQRLIGLRPSTSRQIRRYLDRRPAKMDNPSLLVTSRNRTVSKVTVDSAFRRCTDHLGMVGRNGSKKPRLHDFRHTFAVRSLEACEETERAVENHIVALCAYLGHTSIRSTYYYLQLLPERKRELARQVLEAHDGTF